MTMEKNCRNKTLKEWIGRDQRCSSKTIMRKMMERNNSLWMRMGTLSHLN